jgi:cell division transport system permease protein
MVILLSRVIKYGIQNFWRNGLLSSATIVVMILALTVFSSLIIFGSAANTTISSLQEKIDISVYFKTSADEGQILALKGSLEELEEVRAVEYISRDQALEAFKEKHKDDPAVIQSLDELGDNPLSASLNVRAKDPKYYADISSFLESEAPAGLIDKINFSENQVVIERLSKIVNTLRMGGIILAIVLALIAFLIAFNTIRLAIFSNRESIEIMRLVGASNSLIRGPYIVEGIIHGLIASFITTILFIPLVYILGPYLKILVPEFGLVSYFWSHIFVLLGGQILISGGIGIFSSLIAMRKHLKV